MIKKTILVSIILFALYSGMVILNPRMSATQHQWQGNVVKVEKFIYNKSDTIHSIIVGSSLANRIMEDSLPGFYNLSFAGQGILDGLEIIKNSGKYPKNIFVETNSILSERDKTFISTLFSPIPFYVKKYCTPLRSDKQPLAFIFPLVQEILHKKIDAKEYETKAVSADPKEKALATAMFNKVLEMEIQTYAKDIDPGYLTKQFDELKSLIGLLKSKGVNIIFFEMPLNPNLVELALSKSIRKRFYDFFPENENNYIKVPDCSGYVTTDGLHLNDREAALYTAYFKEAARKYQP